MHRASLIVGLAALLTSAAPTRADRILGEWCPPSGGASLLVRAEDAVSFSGIGVDAQVDRHNVAFTIPDGAPDAGARFVGRQLSDEQVRVTIGDKAAVIWTPCRPVS